MYLRRLELQGFKTFANRTSFEFVPETGGRRGLTGIVGPNGSGKSNVADAIRWVMGEQSMKLLRGKKSEDVIFSGSDRKARSGFAEVSLVLENDDHPDLDMTEIVITRRLYRDGQSEYEVNRESARLADVVLLLAQCGIGQRTYSVIGQGMVDAVLVASPAERKEFFDEASGLRPFQLKRQAAMNKLDATKENLKQAEMLLQEIGPRLASLERQVKRLQERDRVEADLKELERTYYGATWAGLRRDIHAADALLRAAQGEVAARAAETAKLEGRLAELEKATPPSEGFRELRATLETLTEERARLRERQLRLETSKEVALVRAEKPWSPLPLSKIIEAIESIREKHETLIELVDAGKDLKKIKAVLEELRASNADLLSRLQRPAPEPAAAPAVDPAIEKEFRALEKEMAGVQSKIEETERRIDEWNTGEESKRSHIFELQHTLTAARREAQEAERKAGEAAVQMARLETRRDGFLEDVRTHAAALEADLDALADASAGKEGAGDPAALAPKLTRLRSQLEWIGGIDPEVLKEHDETKKRFDDIATKADDLKQAMSSLDTIIAELDTTIKERAETAFRLLDKEFNLYFKKLFGGGDAKLIEVAPEPELDEEGNVVSEPDPNAPPVGIEIQATPPGKRMKSIALLSGGERALTSIALICAIMATNPSPFIVLDEVDAALDESNSLKFADILTTLSDRTQFIVITHNRATMQTAHVLYGVTMGEDGVSQLLSVKLEQAPA